MQQRMREEVNEFLERIFRGSPLSSGPIERIFFNYLRNWLGRPIKDEERVEIREIAKESYDGEWKKSCAETHSYIEEAERKTGLSGNVAMNQKLSMMVLPFITALLEKRRKNRKLRILDIGAGSGSTTQAVLYAMRMECLELIERCHFVTLEPAYAKVEEEDVLNPDEKDPRLMIRKPSNMAQMAAKLRELHGIYRPRWTPVGDVFETYMTSLAPNYFDVIISGSAMHHIPDPKYWFVLKDKLADDGIIVFADWFTNIFSHPALLVPTLRDLQIPGRDIRKYEDFFGLEMQQSLEIESTFTEEQAKSLEQMRGYIRNLSDELRRAGKSKMEGDSALLLFEGHHSHAETIKAATEAGFTSDRDDIIKHGGVDARTNTTFNVNPGSDISTVFALAPRKPKRVSRPPPFSGIPGPNRPQQQVLKLPVPPRLTQRR